MASCDNLQSLLSKHSNQRSYCRRLALSQYSAMINSTEPSNGSFILCFVQWQESWFWAEKILVFTIQNISLTEISLIRLLVKRKKTLVISTALMQFSLKKVNLLNLKCHNIRKNNPFLLSWFVWFL